MTTRRRGGRPVAGRAGSAEERAFVRRYQRTFRFPRPSVTVDVVVFTLREGKPSLLLIRRGNHPYRGAWAVPGGFVEVGDGFRDQGEDLPVAAERELEEETGLPRGSVALELFGAFGRPYRDPRIRTVTIAYLAVVPPAAASSTVAGDDAAEVRWFPLSGLRRVRLAFDHAGILAAAVAHLRRRLRDSALPAALLPARFTLAEARDRLVALDPALAGPGFRRVWRRLLEDGLVRPAGGGSRPPRYRYSASAPRRPAARARGRKEAR